MLPKIKVGIINIIDHLKQKEIKQSTIARLNMLYAKDYNILLDILHHHHNK